MNKDRANFASGLVCAGSVGLKLLKPEFPEFMWLKRGIIGAQSSNLQRLGNLWNNFSWNIVHMVR